MAHNYESKGSSPEARAARIKEARHIANLSLKQMTNDGLLNYNTLCGWETAKHGGLTEKGAIKVSQKLEKEGVSCPVEWLLYGLGDKPYLASQQVGLKEIKFPLEFIENCRSLIKKSYPSLTMATLTDHAMSPIYKSGDTVFGLPVPFNQINDLHNKVLLCLLKSGELVVRKLLLDKQGNKIHLQAINPDFANVLLTDVDIQKCFQIVCNIKYPDIPQSWSSHE